MAPQKYPLALTEDDSRRRREGSGVKLKPPVFSDLNDKELMSILGESRRFELCHVVLKRRHLGLSDHKLFGIIQASVAAGDGGFSSSDPLLRSSSRVFIFNREFNNPVHLPRYIQPLHDVGYCSLPVSSTSHVQIAANLYVATDKIDDVEEYLHEDTDYRSFHPRTSEPLPSPKTYPGFWEEYVSEWINISEKMSLAPTQEQIPEDASLDNEVQPIPEDDNEDDNDLKYVSIDHEVFHACDDHTLINISDTPSGGAGCRTLYGEDGYLRLYYVVLKYAVDAELEVEFDPPPNAAYTEVTGSLWAYYGKGFDYDNHADNCRVWLLDPGSYVTPGRVNLYRSVLAVPANYPLIIKANLSQGGVDLLSATLEIHVPVDLCSYESTILADGYSLKVRVKWKRPSEDSEDLKIRSSNSSLRCHLAKRRKFGAHSTSTMTDPDVSLLTSSTMADPDECNRWSLQEEITKVFNTSLKSTYKLKEDEDVLGSISSCTKEEGGDYLCSSVMHIWPHIKSCHFYEGPKHTGVAVKDYIMASEYKDMMERCVVCGPGFVKFKLCRKWIAKSIHKMITVGIATWAPKLPVKKAMIVSQTVNMTAELPMDHLRSLFIGDTLSRMLRYSGADVDHTQIDRIYPESCFEGRDPRQLMDYVNDTIRGNFRRLYYQQGIYMEKTIKSLYGFHIRDIVKLAREKGFCIGSEEDELLRWPLLLFGRALKERKTDWIVHVSDVGKRVYFEMCITAAKSAGLIANDDPKCPLSHVGFGLVQGDDPERFRTSSTNVNLKTLFGEAKSRCKVLLARQDDITDEWTADELEIAAETLGHNAIRYADLKNNRLTNYTFSFDQMFTEEGNTAVYLQFTYVRICSIIKNYSKYIKELMTEELILKHDDERELGLHLLRFTEVLTEVCTNVTPHILCDYLHGLCKKFNSLDSSKWQADVSIEVASKLLLYKATEQVMEICFYLLGIPPINHFTRMINLGIL